MTEKQPVLYLSHGAPPLLDDELWMNQLAKWSGSVGKPRGIVIVSAHWESAPISISATAANTPLIYDFGGFAPKPAKFFAHINPVILSRTQFDSVSVDP